MVIGIVSIYINKAKGFSSLAVVAMKLRTGNMEKLQHTNGNPNKHMLY